MKNSVRNRKAVFTAFALFLMSTACSQKQKTIQHPDYGELAHRIVSTTVNIKPGEVVVINGGQHTIPLMEVLGIEAQKVGGLVNLFLSTDPLSRSYYIDVPEKYLEIEQVYFAEWLKYIDIWIGLPGVEDYKSFITGVPENRLAKILKANEVVDNMVNQAKIRLVSIGYPTKEGAKNVNLDFKVYEKMHWSAVNADYASISQKGNTLKSILQNSKTVRVTSPSGTDISFTVGDRPIFVDDGIITEENSKSTFIFERYASLPGGQVFFAPLEISANGKVVVPRTLCRYEPFTNISFEFTDGQMTNLKADEGIECFNESMAPYTGPKDMFGSISIGLNPELKVIEGASDYRPGNAAGMVWINIGDNRLYSGSNNTFGGFGFPIVKATVIVDDKTVIKDGELVL